MTLKRGDVVPAKFPFATGTTAKKRPVLVVQADSYNLSMHNAHAGPTLFREEEGV